MTEEDDGLPYGEDEEYDKDYPTDEEIAAVNDGDFDKWEYEQNQKRLETDPDP
jgi:hypothetical protein